MHQILQNYVFFLKTFLVLMHSFSSPYLVTTGTSKVPMFVKVGFSFCLSFQGLLYIFGKVQINISVFSLQLLCRNSVRNKGLFRSALCLT